MKNKITFIFTIFLSLFLFPNLVSAKCSEKEINDLNKLVDNITIKYEHTGNNLFTVTLHNIPENITASTTLGSFNSTYVDNPTNSVENFIGGTTYKLFFASNSRNACGKVLLKDKVITIPKYNKYSEKEICKNEKYEEFEYCNEFYDGVITDELFEQKLKEFEESLKENRNETKDNENILLSFIKNNYIYIIIGLILIIILTMSIVVYRRKNRKF